MLGEAEKREFDFRVRGIDRKTTIGKSIYGLGKTWLCRTRAMRRGADGQYETALPSFIPTFEGGSALRPAGSALRRAKLARRTPKPRSGVRAGALAPEPRLRCRGLVAASRSPRRAAGHTWPTRFTALRAERLAHRRGGGAAAPPDRFDPGLENEGSRVEY